MKKTPLYYNVRPAKAADGTRIDWSDLNISERREMFRWFKSESAAIAHALQMAGAHRRPFDVTAVYEHGRAEYVELAPVTETHNARYIATEPAKRKPRKAPKRKPARKSRKSRK